MSVPFGGLDSTYDFRWKVFRAGVRGEYPLGSRAVLRGSVGYLFGITYRGEAFWNLRTDYRRTAPNFVHEASSGSGSDVRVSLAYLPRPFLGLEVGYRRIRLKAGDGIDTVYLADGSTLASDLNSVQSTRSGFFLEVTGRY